MIAIHPFSPRHHLSAASDQPPPSPLSASSAVPLSSSLPSSPFLLSALPTSATHPSLSSLQCPLWSELPSDVLLLIFTSYLPAYNDHCALSRTCRSYRTTLSQPLAFAFMSDKQRWPRLPRQQFVDKLRAVTFYAQATHTGSSFSLTTPATFSSSLLPQSLSSGISHLFLPSASSVDSHDSRVWLVTSAPVCAFKVYDRVQEKVVDSVSPSLSFSAVDVCGSNVLLAHAHTSMLYLYSLTTHELTPINKKRARHSPSAAATASSIRDDTSSSSSSVHQQPAQPATVVVKHTSSVTCVRMIALPDGRLLGASGSYDATVRCWDLQTGEQIAQLKSDNEMTVWCVDIHPTGTLLCCGSNDKTVRVYQLHTTSSSTASYTSSKGDDNGELLCRLEGHTRTPMVTKFDPYEADRCLFSAGYDAVIRQWDYRAGVQLRKFKGHANIIFSLAITPHVVVSSSRDGTLRIHDRCSRALLRVLTPRPHYSAAASSSSATSLSSSIGDIKTVVMTERGDAILCGTSSGLLYEWQLRERGTGGVYGSSSDSDSIRGVRSIEASLSAITEPKLMNVFKSLRGKLAGIGNGTAR